MRVFLAALYTIALAGATPAVADRAAAEAVRAGDMRKLVIHETPRDLPEVTLVMLDDAPRSLAEWRGEWVVVNFWATWCAPCRHEMPSLDALAATGQPVVTVATGRNPPPAIERFWAETAITHLPALRDPKSALARQLGILGLPVTLILNPEGQEVARLTGDADWASPDAAAVLAALRD
ncbi:MAG: TlpA family protein disulfide reductase [Paracoccaceae bacterium]|nr:MAG: TlpA family protein disulfide reductase [Paracoccaceae bacterium]